MMKTKDLLAETCHHDPYRILPNFVSKYSSSGVLNTQTAGMFYTVRVDYILQYCDTMCDDKWLQSEKTVIVIGICRCSAS
jgi:hypothetical protein